MGRLALALCVIAVTTPFAFARHPLPPPRTRAAAPLRRAPRPLGSFSGVSLSTPNSIWPMPANITQPVNPTPCAWSAPANNSYISGCADGGYPCQKFPTLAQAQAACAADYSCGGVTSQDGGGPPWETRHGTRAIFSGQGEVSYLIANACHASGAVCLVLPPSFAITAGGGATSAVLQDAMARYTAMINTAYAPTTTAPPGATQLLGLRVEVASASAALAFGVDESYSLTVAAGGATLRAMTFTDASLKAISKAALRDLWGRLFGLLRADFSRVESLRGRILVTKAELFSGLMALQGALPPEVPEEKDVLPCPEPPKPTRKRDVLVAGFPEDAGADKGPLVPHGASAANSPVGSLESSDDDGEFGDGSSVFRCPATAQAKSAGVQPLARPAIPTVSAVQVRCPGCAVVWLAEMGVARPLGDLCAACGMKLTGPAASGGAPPPQMTLLASSGAGESVNPFALLSGLDAPGSTPLEDRVGWAASGRFRTFFFGPGAVGFSPGCTRPPPPFGGGWHHS